MERGAADDDSDEEERVVNRVESAYGPVVQAGTIHGGVHFHATTASGQSPIGSAVPSSTRARHQNPRPSPDGAQPVPMSLPPDLADFTGREHELRELLVAVEQAAGARDALATAVDRARSVPNDGVGYGVLRHLSPHGPEVGRLRALPEPRVLLVHVPGDLAAFDSGIGLLRTR